MDVSILLNKKARQAKLARPGGGKAGLEVEARSDLHLTWAVDVIRIRGLDRAKVGLVGEQRGVAPGGLADGVAACCHSGGVLVIERIEKLTHQFDGISVGKGDALRNACIDDECAWVGIGIPQERQPSYARAERTGQRALRIAARDTKREGQPALRLEDG